MDEFWRLLVLSFSMFVGCYLAGSIPLILTLSEGVLRKVTTFGAGLLIGTALIVIIPEGMESLFALGSHHNHAHSESPVIKLDDVVNKVEPQPPDPNNPPGQQPLPEIPQGDLQQENKGDSENKDNPPPNKAGEELEGGEDEKPGPPVFTTDQLQFFFGLSLVTGFLFMMLIDQCGGGHSHAHISVDGGELGRHKRKNMTATIGLVVHAAADGLALGAAAGLSKADVEFVIFMAIMLHKAPAAFGFTSFLIHEGFDKTTAKRHLLVFALAAPLAAFAAYFGLIKVLYTIQLPFTGIAMLFSAGTFLYVATVHVLSELTQPSPSSSTSSLTSDLSGSSSNKSKLNKLELLLVSVGALLPLLFSVFHSHGH